MGGAKHYPNNSEDKLSPRWDMSQERAFMESLLGQRVNFFLVFFSVVIVGAVNAKNGNQVYIQPAILTVGAFVAFLLMLAFGRAQRKLDTIFEILFSDPAHPATIINSMTKGGSRRKLVGLVVPAVCVLVLATWAAYCWLAILSEYCLQLRQ